MKLQKIKAFTLVELIVVITILAILGTIAFISLTSYSETSRDSVRISDLSTMKSSLELFHIEAGKYPLTTNGYDVTYGGGKVWTQGIFGEDTFKNVDKLDKIPKDPLTEKEYTYSLTNTRQEYELAGIMEAESLTLNQDLLTKTNASEQIVSAMVTGNYNGEMLNVTKSGTTCIVAIPSIISATEAPLETIVSNDYFVYNNYRNLPSNYGQLTRFKLLGEPNLKLVNDSNMDLYCGNLEQLKTNESLRVDFVDNMQKAYSGTQVEVTGRIKEILELSIDKNNPQPDLKIYTIDLIEEVLGTPISEAQKLAAGECNTGYIEISGVCTQSSSITSLDQFVGRGISIGNSLILNGDGFINQNFTRCSDILGKELWSDNCTDLGNSQVVITSGSRSNLPLAINDTRINLTKEVGVEPNYTTAGISYSGNNNYKQWYYSNTGVITNDMLDGAIFTITNAENLNIYDEVILRFGSAIPYIVLTIDGTVGGKSFNTTYSCNGGCAWIPSGGEYGQKGATAINVGNLLAGTYLKIINNGSIQGGPGAGGQGNRCGNTSLVYGGAGGDAIVSNVSNIQIDIENNNQIFAGGGGGRGNTVGCYCDVVKLGGSGQGYGVSGWGGAWPGSHGCDSGASGGAWGSSGGGGSSSGCATKITNGGILNITNNGDLRGLTCN